MIALRADDVACLRRKSKKRRFQMIDDTNATAPEIPEVLAGIVIGFGGLHDFKPRSPQRRGAGSGRTVAGAGLHPDVVLDPKSGINYLVPDDLAAIYKIGEVYSHGWYRTGQSSAIAGESDVDVSDIAAFQQRFNLPPHDPRKILAPPS